MRYALFILLALCCHLSAQPSIQWQKCLGGSNSDELVSATQSMDQSFFLIGFTTSNNGDITNPKGNGDVWVIKLDSAGGFLWQKCLGGSSTDLPAGFILSGNDGFIISGSSISNDGDVSGNHGDVDFWVVKLNDQGILEWQKSLGGSKGDYCQALTATPDGGYILTGSTESNDGDVLGNHGQSDIWVVKLNHSGDIEWQKCLGGSGTDNGYSIIAPVDGGYTIAGGTNSKDGDVTSYFGNSDYWVIHLDESGNILWQHTYGGVGIDQASKILQFNNSKDYIVMGIAGSGNTGQVTGSHGSYDYWPIRISKTGELIWQKALGGSDADWGRSASISPSGGVTVAGLTISTNGDVLDNDGGADMWIVQLDENGTIEWQKTLGGTQAEELYSINTSKDGGYIVTGKTWSNNGDVSGNHGTYDGWVVKLSPTNTPTLTPTLTQLTLYPNPTNQQLTLQTPDNEPITSIQITDLSAKTLKTEQAPQDKTLQVAILPKGMYLLKATSDSGKVFCGRFIKE